ESAGEPFLVAVEVPRPAGCLPVAERVTADLLPAPPAVEVAAGVRGDALRIPDHPQRTVVRGRARHEVGARDPAGQSGAGALADRRALRRLLGRPPTGVPLGVPGALLGGTGEPRGAGLGEDQQGVVVVG